MKLNDLREERGRVIAEGRKILDKADAEKRGLNDEERAKYDELMKKQRDLKARIEDEERQLELDRETAGRQESEDRTQATGTDEEKRKLRIKAAFRKYLIEGRDALTADEVREMRALQQNTNVLGGYWVAPQDFVNELIIFVNNIVYIRGKATIFPVVGAQSLGAPSLDTDIDDADWTSELGTGNEDAAMAAGKRELIPHPLAKRIKISNKLMRNGAIDVETLVRSRMGYKFGVSMEKGYLLGTGQNQPLGIFTASSMGISTGRDISSGNTNTSIGFDGLYGAKYGLKVQYRAKASWMFHRDAVDQISKLKDSYGRYLWQPSQQAGQPDLLLGLPVMESEYVPNTFTTGLYVGALADWSHYWIADALDMQVQRLVELYAEANQTGFIGRLETDGMPVLEEAFVRVKLT